MLLQRRIYTWGESYLCREILFPNPSTNFAGSKEEKHMNKRFIAYYLLTLSLTVPSQLALRNLQTVSETKPVEYVSAKQDTQMIEEN